MPNGKKTDIDEPPIVEDLLCVKGGRLGNKVVKVPIEYADIDGVKIRIFRVRKRDFWLLAPFLNRYPTGTKDKETINETLAEIQTAFQKAILAKRAKQKTAAAEGAAEEAAEGRAAVGLSSDEDENSDSGVEVPAGGTADGTEKQSKTESRQGKHKKKGAAQSMEGLKLEEIFVERDTDYTKFRVVEPCNIRGFRVEATRESVLHAINMADEIMKRAKTMEAEAQPKQPKSWKQQAATAEEHPDDPNTIAIRGIIGWNPSHKAWAIFYKNAAGRDAQRLIKEFRVGAFPDEGSGGSRKRFLKRKAQMYQTACQQWNSLDKSKRPRLAV